MSAITELDAHRRRQWVHEEKVPGGGIVYVTDKYDDAFSVGLLNEITVLYNTGWGLEKLAEKFKRNPVEILFAIIRQADEGKITRPLAYRRK